MKASAVGIIVIFSLVFFPVFVLAEEGSYDALVTTDSGSSISKVDVEDEEVLDIQPSTGQDMSVYGAQRDDSGEVSGIDSKGEDVSMYAPEEYQPEGPSQSAEESDPSAYPSYQY